MEQVHIENLSPISPDTWVSMATTTAGPGTFVFMVTCPLTDTESMHVQIMVDPESGGTPVVFEDYLSTPADLASASAHAGFQSSPVPLPLDTWTAKLRAKNDGPIGHWFNVRVIKL